MKMNLFKAVLTLGSAVMMTVVSADLASAYTIGSEEDYNNQLGSKFGLDYSTWSQFNGYINTESNGLAGEDLTVLDLDDVTWETGVNDVEVFFINEGAGYRNQFYYSTDGGTNLTTLWNDVASPYSILSDADGPMSLGEGVSLGNFAGSTVLDFFLRNPEGNLFGADMAANPDNFQHVTVYQSGEYLLLGYEDLTWGGDRDYNDVVIAVKGLVKTEDVPEPATTGALFGIGLLGAIRSRRQKANLA